MLAGQLQAVRPHLDLLVPAGARPGRLRSRVGVGGKAHLCKLGHHVDAGRMVDAHRRLAGKPRVNLERGKAALVGHDLDVKDAVDAQALAQPLPDGFELGALVIGEVRRGDDALGVVIGGDAYLGDGQLPEALSVADDLHREGPPLDEALDHRAAPQGRARLLQLLGRVRPGDAQASAQAVRLDHHGKPALRIRRRLGHSHLRKERV